MPRLAAWLLLVVALAGPMLTHAEAAEDLARALIGAGDAGGIGTPDGRVGDDPNVASVTRTGPTVDAFRQAMPAWDAPAVVVRVVGPLPRDPEARRGNGCHAPGPASARAAWLQVFLC